jgi:hypothetical protein
MMRKALLGFVGLLAIALPGEPANAWMHAGRYGTASGGGGSWQAHGWAGGSASGGGGSWHATGAYGGTASGGGGSWKAEGAYGGHASGGGGSWHATGAYGGTASGGGGSWHATGAYGGTAYGGYDHYNGAYYGAYHQPVVVNTYYHNGCYNCGGWGYGAAAAAGVVAGAAVGAAAANTANTNAYAAGVAAGTASATYGSYIMNDVYSTLPAGCNLDPRNGVSYYACGPTWFKPGYGANGVFYRVVPYPG